MYLVKICLILFFLIELFAIESKDMGVIINLSGKQRMLSQKITKDALLIILGIDKEVSMKNLWESSSLYNKTLNALINGDKELKLTAVKSEKIKKHLLLIKEKWDPFFKNVFKIPAKENKDALIYLLDNNEELLFLHEELVSLYKNEVSSSFDNDIGKLMIQNIDLAGKQGMLLQKMAKEKLLIISGFKKDKNQKKLNATITLFDKTLRGLKVGDDDLKLSGTIDENLLKQLSKVFLMWDKLKPLYEKEILSDEELKTIIQGNSTLGSEMDKAISLYEDLVDY